MNLIKTSLLSGLATIIKILMGFVSNKILAIYVGPSGIALLGQFSNYVGMATSFGNGGINSGVTKYLAEYSCDANRQKKVVRTSLSIACYCSIIFGCLNYFGAREISLYIFGTTEYILIIKLFAVSLVFASLNSTILSILNGYKQIKLFISLGILNNIIGLGLTYILVVKYHTFGALLSIVLVQSIVCIVTVLLVSKFAWFEYSFLKIKIDKLITINLLKYTAMALTTAFIVPVSQIMIRNYLVQHLSLNAAGYWQAVWKISEVYLMVVTTAISTYYLPRLSEIVDIDELKIEIARGYKILLPITAILASSIYLLRDYIVLVLFTPQFMPMSDLFLFQLLGDMLKITAWLLAYLMVARAMTSVFMITEIVFGISFVSFTFLFVNAYGLIGVTYAYALNYLLYLITIIIIIRKKVFKRNY